MKFFLPIILLILFCFQGFGQQPPPFSYEGTYYGELYKKDKVLADVRMSLTDSVYVIYYFGIDKEQKEIRKRYIGTFTITPSKLLILRGKHPFREDKFIIHDVITPSESLHLSFTIPIKESLAPKKGYNLEMISRRRKNPNNTWEDGCCGFDFFTPRIASIFKNQSTKILVFNELQSKFGMKCNTREKAIRTEFMKHNYSENPFFKVDSTRFDTLYVNRIFLQKQSVYQVEVDTFCLDRTAKIRITNFSANHIQIPEHTEVFDEPDIESAFLYDRAEMDKMEELRIVDYLEDAAGIEWIKVEIDVSVYNEDADETDTQYITKKISGWMLQRLLAVY